MASAAAGTPRKSRGHGTAFKTRFKLLRERTEAMKEIWTKTTAEYHGEFVDFGPMQTRPKPSQKPHPPIIVGGAFPHATGRALRSGRWLDTDRRPGPLWRRQRFVPKFRQMAAEAGPPSQYGADHLFGGIQDVDLLKRYRDMGVAGVVRTLPPEPAEPTLPVLGRWAELIRRVNA